MFRGGVDLLTVDATVVDSSGRQVTDLQPTEFTVEVDGSSRPVVSAEYIKLVDDAPVPVGARKPAPPQAPDEEFFLHQRARADARPDRSCCSSIRATSAPDRDGR